MRRYWIPSDSLENETVILKGEVLHHIRDVCRMRIGAKFEVITEEGKAYLVEITSESKRESIAAVRESREIPAIARPHIHLALSIPRFPVFEAVVEKSVELGVKAVHPFFSDYSFIRKQEDVFAKKRQRFERIVQGATQQSGRGDLMPIAEPLPLPELLKSFNRTGTAQGLFAYEGQSGLVIRDALAQLRKKNSEEVWVFVGSEGGFSEAEVELFQAVGLRPVTLGSQVLRVETACVALLSVIKYDLDLMR